MKMWPTAGALLAVLLLGGTSFGGDNSASGRVGVSPGGKAPGFSAANLRGEILELAKLQGKYRAVVITFWGLRCGECIEEMPHLNAISAKYADRVVVLGVNTDGVDGETLSGQIRKIGLDIRYEVVPDPDLLLIDLFAMTAAPLTLVIGPDGTLAYRHEGFRSGDEKGLEEVLASLLR
jgi:peroxiredoxin